MNTSEKIMTGLIKDMLNKKRGFYLGPYKGMSDVFDNDPWFRSFYMEIASLYGYPVSRFDSISKQDKILSAFASINITIALEEHIKIWHPWWKAKQKITPELAELFCRKVFEIRGEQIIPIM